MPFSSGNQVWRKRLPKPPKVDCPKCGKPRQRRVRPSGVAEWVCAPCHAERANKWRNQNIEMSRALTQSTKLKRLYGITTQDKERMVAERDGLCDMCHQPPKPGKRKEDGVLHVDHDHETGDVRGLLCGPCNRALGHFEKVRSKAEAYLAGPPAIIKSLKQTLAK